MRRLHHYFGYASDLISTNEVGSAWKAYERVDPCTFSLKTEELRINLTAFYKEYHARTWDSSSSISSAPTPHDLVTESPLDDDLDNVNIKRFTHILYPHVCLCLLLITWVIIY